MSQRRIRRRQAELPTLPYWRSILASCLLVVSMMFFFEVLADPRSAELRSPGLVAPVFVLVALVDASVFYAEFRLQKRRTQSTVRTKQKVALNGERPCVD